MVLVCCSCSILASAFPCPSCAVTSDDQPTTAGVTLLSQLANMPSMSPLITSPVPSVGSVVPNSMVPSASIMISNGITQGAPEVRE